LYTLDNFVYSHPSYSYILQPRVAGTPKKKVLTFTVLLNNVYTKVE